MIKPIVHDTFFLSQKAVPATPDDMPVARDLLDTLKANEDHCVGLAANMIGVNKSIIVISMNVLNLVMFNPVIVSKSEPYEAEEECLSLHGSRKTTRYKQIQVTFQDMKFETVTRSFSGLVAQIIQHEVDHCNGILI